MPPVPAYMCKVLNYLDTAPENTLMGSYGVPPTAPMAPFGNVPGQMMGGIGFTTNQTPGSAPIVTAVP